jgi:hypothetical protein
MSGKVYVILVTSWLFAWLEKQSLPRPVSSRKGYPDSNTELASVVKHG